MSWIRIKWPWILIPEYKVAYCYHSKAACTSIVASLSEATGRNTVVPHKAFQGHRLSMIDFWKMSIPEDYFTFTFVRNPFDRLVSCYEDRVIRKKGRGFPREFNSKMSFRDFILGVQIIFPGNAHIHPYWNWMIDCKGMLFPDFVGSVETMDEDWDKLRKVCPIKLPDLRMLNKTNHKNYKSYYTPKTREIVTRLYSDDLILFGYTF